MGAPQEAIAVPADHLMGVYNRAPLAFERGEGVRLYTAEGEAYLDCLAGIAVNALGHAHPRLVEAVQRQAQKLWHVSNIFRIPDQEALAHELTDACFADVCFFTNSGTEAVECALKTARKFHSANGQPERIDVIGFDGSFHGRTYAAVNASGNPGYIDGFGPRLPGYVQLTFGDHEAIRAAIAAPTTAAVIVEPVQGEGGARFVPDVCLRGLRKLCTEHGVLLIYDEVQCGLSRTGKLFAYEWAERPGEPAAPDIMCLAKALGGGFPVGACLATAQAASGMTVGAHGSTYGGNPLAMAVAREAFAMLRDEALLEHVRETAGWFTQQLSGLRDRYPDVVLELRGRGLLIGLKLAVNNRAFMQLARGDNCVRLLPPLIITREEAREAGGKLEQACEAARAAARAATQAMQPA